MAEQMSCNHQVVDSTPAISFAKGDAMEPTVIAGIILLVFEIGGIVAAYIDG